MPDPTFPLSQLVSVRPRFLRSVNLERDFIAPDALNGYVQTPSASAALERITAGIDSPALRAWSITGPYGTGKSAFALRLTQTLAAQGFRPVLVTGGREPLAQSLLRALEREGPHPPAPAREVAALYEQAAQKQAAQGGGLLLIIDELGKFLEYAALHPQHGDVQVLQEMAEAAVRSQDAPLMVITVLHQAFDEYAHRLPAATQAEWRKVQGRFQDLPFGDAADDAARLVAGAISRPSYPEADALLKDTFTRYADESRALSLQPRTLSPKEWKDIVRRAWPLHPAALLAAPHLFRRFGQNERSLFGWLASAGPHGFADFVGRHTLTPDSVPALRVADLYDYMTDALGLSTGTWAQTADALLRAEGRPPAWAALIKTIGVLHALGDSARLPASREMLRFACDDFSPAEVDAALEALQSSTLVTYRHYKRAFRPYAGSDLDVDALVRDARADAHSDPVAVAARLGLSSLPIVARRHSFQTGTLRFFDVRPCRPADLENADTLRVPDGADGLLLLCLTGEGQAPSFGNGPHPPAPSPVGTGEGEQKDNLSDPLPLAGEGGASPVAPGEGFLVPMPGEGLLLAGGAFFSPHILLRVAPETDALRGAAADADALQRVSDHTPELAQDGTARREVDERLREAVAVFESEWDALLRDEEESPLPNVQHPLPTLPLREGKGFQTLSYPPSLSEGEGAGEWGSSPSFYFWQGQVQTGKSVQHLLSAACDTAYCLAAPVRNELINRRQLTSVAAATRRELITAMLTRAKDERLGMDADLWPPERSMYVSTLLETGLHRQIAPATEDDDGRGLCAPEPGTPFAAVWQAVV